VKLRRLARPSLLFALAMVPVCGGVVTALRHAQDPVTPHVNESTRWTVRDIYASRPDAGRAWAQRVHEKTRIPARALLAYASAEVQLAIEAPDCGLSWSTLAGIGAVESDHGRYAGRTLRKDGTSTRRIFGIALNGRPGFKAIADTDNGALDRDRRWDRAVGPMQFIPSTWAGSRADGDGDGRKDPQDIDDAALAAGRYLCRTGIDMRSWGDRRRAILSYNNSGAYLRLVSTHASKYAATSKEARGTTKLNG
jgi:membrane-bound lytic murein transglycosylase B